MFGKKSMADLDNSMLATNVQTIPADFYGGINPVVNFKKVEKEVVLPSLAKPDSPASDLNAKPKLTPAEKKILDKITAAGNNQPLHAANIFSNKKYMIIFLSSFFVVALIGGGIYYYWQINSQPNIAIPVPPQISIAPSPVPESTNITTATVEVPTTTPPESVKFLADAPIDFPSNLLGDSADLDKDNITDVAENLFHTDPSKPDTDEDGYNDGHEVFYLYNPAGKEPIRLIESGNIKEYQNPVFGYKLYYPTEWAVGSVDEEGRDVLFSTITGENIEVRTFDLPSSQTFSDWFVQWAPNQSFDKLLDFQTKFFEPGKNRVDNLVYYFTDSQHVYVLLYHTTDSNTVNFRSVMVMMARSFRSKDFVMPENPVAATSSYLMEMPSTINPSGL